jgi:hypothetical protein
MAMYCTLEYVCFFIYCVSEHFYLNVGEVWRIRVAESGMGSILLSIYSGLSAWLLERVCTTGIHEALRTQYQPFHSIAEARILCWWPWGPDPPPSVRPPKSGHSAMGAKGLAVNWRAFSPQHWSGSIYKGRPAKSPSKAVTNL